MANERAVPVSTSEVQAENSEEQEIRRRATSNRRQPDEE